MESLHAQLQELRPWLTHEPLELDDMKKINIEIGHIYKHARRCYRKYKDPEVRKYLDYMKKEIVGGYQN
ncbi:MAG: hypothetical protein U9O94_04540 [Nanoarchaeota archaeon]|nr:hypothetical protein [Nanoarchaeota archaeon]